MGWWRVGMRPRVGILNSRERAVRERADACGIGVLRPTPPRARVYLYGWTRARPTTNLTTTPVEGYLGSRNDEERSEMRYVM